MSDTSDDKKHDKKDDNKDDKKDDKKGLTQKIQHEREMIKLVL